MVLKGKPLSIQQIITCLNNAFPVITTLHAIGQGNNENFTFMLSQQERERGEGRVGNTKKFTANFHISAKNKYELRNR